MLLVHHEISSLTYVSTRSYGSLSICSTAICIRRLLPNQDIIKKHVLVWFNLEAEAGFNVLGGDECDSYEIRLATPIKVVTLLKL